jgi:hypothetical protein
MSKSTYPSFLIGAYNVFTFINQEKSYESPLLKCPDKSAILTFKVRGMMKE